MIQEGKFGVQEAAWLAIITTCIKLFFTSPAWLSNYVGTAGWQMTLISCLTSVVAFSFVLALLKRFPGKNIIDIFTLSLGKFIGFIFSIVFSVTLLQEASVLVREFTEVMKVYVYPETTTELIAGTFIMVVAVVSFLGLETLARVAKLSAYALLFIFLTLVILSLNNLKWDNLYPIMGYGIKATVIHGFARSSSYAEIMIIAVFAGSLQGIRNIRKAGYISLAASGVILTGGLFLVNTAFPLETLQELIAPVFVIARDIKYGSFFQRLDALFLFLWIFSTLIAVSALFYCSVSCYCKAFRFSDWRPAVVPMTILFYVLAFIPKDFTTIIEGSVQMIRNYGWAVFYVLPVIALIASVLRKKRGAS